MRDPLYAHVDRGRVNGTGPVVIALGGGYQSSGCVVGVAPALLAQIEARPSSYYLNIYDRRHPGGAVRGQV